MSYELIMRAVAREPWAILPAKMEEIMALLQLRAAGHNVSPEQVEAAVSQRRSPVSAQATVAVLPVMGVIHHRANITQQTSGGTTTEALSGAFRQAVDNPQIGSILLHVDSPGGAVSGLQEFADQVYAARDVKPVVAVADGMAASAAYWIATSASEFYVTPSSEVGSIGAVMAHVDMSEHERMEGVKTTLIHAGKNKVTGNPYAPLSDEDRAILQESVDRANDNFVTAVARNRGVTKAVVNADFGQGLMFPAKQAVQLGMADRVGTLEQAVDRAVSLARRGSQQRRALSALAIADALMIEHDVRS